MDKAEALKRLTSLEGEAKKLLAIIEKADEPKPIMDRVKTFEDALEIYKALNNVEVDFTGTNDEIAYKKIKIIATVLNEGWNADINNTKQYKYYPWFEITGSGFSFCDYLYDCSACHCPSRLSYKNSELAIYAGKQFLDIYKNLFS